MVELIIEESGFPKDRPTLKQFQDSFKIPIEELLRILPGRRILSGVDITYTVGSPGTMTVTEGVVIYNEKLWTVEAYSDVPEQYLSFFEETEDLQFNVGTQAAPVYEARPGKINRVARVGTLANNDGTARIDSFVRGRKILEYIQAGSVFVGPIVVASETAIYHVPFDNVGTKDYQVLANFRAADPEESFSRAFTWDINNRTETGFDIYIQSVGSNSIPLIFDYTVIPINRVLSVGGTP